MRTEKNLFVALLLFGLLSMVLGACAAPTAVVEEPTEEVVEEPTEEVVEEATEEPTTEPTEEPTPEPTADLDGAFASFLGAMEAYNTIQPADVNTLLAEGTELFLVDVREVSEVEENGHIEGAINIPLRTLGQNLDKLPSFDTPIVTYCGSGWRCTIAMTALSALGWTDVKSMVGGSFGGWVEGGFPVVEGVPAEAAALNAATPDPALVAAIDAALSGIPEGWGAIKPEDLNTALIEGEELILIDVRRAEEIEENGYIEGALQIPIEQFIEMKDMWPAKDASIVTYCGVGVRGNIAATILRTYGYKNVLNLQGGLTAWVAGGFPVVTD